MCDKCNVPLVQRADDTRETVENRIEVYESQTKPLLNYYDQVGNIAHMDGSIGLEKLFLEIVKILGE